MSVLVKPIFLTVDTLNVCNDSNYVSSTHDTRKVFPSTHNSISIPRNVSCLENNNIVKYHLPLTNLLSSSKTKSSPLPWISNLNFQSVLSICLISHLLESLMVLLFNAMLLHQPIQNDDTAKNGTPNPKTGPRTPDWTLGPSANG